MDLPEFITTLIYALSFINIVPTEAELTSAFRDIDRNQDGLISYQEYFEFLRYYFGSESFAAQTGGEDFIVPLQSVYTPRVVTAPAPVPVPKQKPKQPAGEMNSQERFSKLIRSQTRVLLMDYDSNKNVVFERD
jgi:Ca2+-binding EF-hand superfamily protein